MMSAIVPLDRAMTISYKLSIVIMSLSAAVWPHFAMQIFCLHPLPMFVEIGLGNRLLEYQCNQK